MLPIRNKQCSQKQEQSKSRNLDKQAKHWSQCSPWGYLWDKMLIVFKSFSFQMSLRLQGQEIKARLHHKLGLQRLWLQCNWELKTSQVLCCQGTRKTTHLNPTVGRGEAWDKSPLRTLHHKLVLTKRGQISNKSSPEELQPQPKNLHSLQEI